MLAFLRNSKHTLVHNEYNSCMASRMPLENKREVKGRGKGEEGRGREGMHGTVLRSSFYTTNDAYQMPYTKAWVSVHHHTFQFICEHLVI